jgi:hypothetical protein
MQCERRPSASIHQGGGPGDARSVHVTLSLSLSLSLSLMGTRTIPLYSLKRHQGETCCAKEEAADTGGGRSFGRISPPPLSSPPLPPLSSTSKRLGSPNNLSGRSMSMDVA